MHHDDTWIGPEPEKSALEGLAGLTIAGRYRIDALLGEGGMGAVFAAFHLGMKRDVAVKVLLPSLTSHAEAAARFEREAQAASRLEHRNIVRVFDFGAFNHEGRELKYLVMERLEGRELAAMLGQPMPQAEALALALEIFEALVHAHTRGVVHRDLKPENVFISVQGDARVKLVDFGIAKLLDGEAEEVKLTRLGAVFGTPQYMSPEQALGEEVDARSDLYAAGLILYEMLAGVPPFRADDIVSLLRMQIQAAPPTIVGLHPGLQRVLDGLLAKQRASRSASAEEVATALRAIDLDDRPSPHWPITLYDRIAPWIEGVPRWSVPGLTWLTVHWKASGAAVGVAVVLSALGYWSQSGADAEATAPAPAVMAPKPALEALADALPMLNAPPSRVEDLRTLVLAGKIDAALAESAVLLEAYPSSAVVHWLKGDALAKLPDRGDEMLQAYRRALELEPALVKDRDVYAQLGVLVRDPKVSPAVIDVLLAADPEPIEPLVLELLHRKTDLLSFDLRHRLLDAASEKTRAKIDLGDQLVLDLWQASAQAKPCQVFDETLTTMASAPRPDYVASLEQVSTPSPVGGSSPCEGLEDARKKLAASMRLQFPEAPNTIPESFTPAKPKKSGRRRRGLGWFR